MLIDAHVHMNLYDDPVLDSVLNDLDRHRIFSVSVAMDIPSYRRTQEIALRSEWLLPVFGVHPWEAPNYADRLDELDDLITESPLLGELGLDYRFIKEKEQYPAQRVVLEHFLKAAQAQNKIVNLHTCGAEADVLALLRRYDLRRAIIHWYSGPLDVLDEMIAFGAMFTVGVEITRSDHIREIARRIPDDQLLTETDNPGGWRGFTGEIGQPGLLFDVVDRLAAVRGTLAEDIAGMVRANFLRLIGDDPRLAGVRAKLAV
ncbi:MAG: TatD family hydrolase [Anaerolineae bacterium]|nr:TatD family hydrolase [Anaerolineae bacterium]